MNAAGQLAVACRYDEVLDFSDGLAAVHDEENNYWGYVDAGGNVALPFQYKEASSFMDGYAKVKAAEKNARLVLIDKTGRNVIPEGYSYFGDADWNYFSTNEGVVLIYKSDTQGVRLLNEAGEIIKPDYGGFDWVNGWEKPFSDGLAWIYSRYEGVAAIFDLAGRAVLKKYWGIDNIFDRGDGYYHTADGLVDKDGNVIAQWPKGVDGSGGKLHEGLLRVYSGDTGTKRYGFMNMAGQVTVPCTYAEVGDFYGGVAPVENFANKWGLVDATGAEVLPLQYDSVKQVEGATGIFLVKEGNKYGLVAAPTVYAANGAIVNYAAQAEVNDALNAGVATEALGGDYRAEITRAQLASEAVKLYEAASGQAAPAAGASPFSDVNDPAVTQAQTLGLIDGLPDGTFVPNATVPKEQAAAILSNVTTKVNGTDASVKAAKFEPEGSTRKTASIEETLATATRILKKIKK